MQALKAQALAKVEEAYVRAEQHFGRKFTRVPVVFSAHQKVTAGTAHFSFNRHTGKVVPVKIKLSLPLLALNKEVFIADTPGHEAAHLIAAEMYGTEGTGHGARWKQVMRVIGQEAKRCHNMETARTVARVEMKCDCTTHQVGKRIAQRIMAGAKYTCKKCKSRLSLVGAKVIEPTAPRVVKPVAAPKVPVVAGASKADIVKTMLRNIKATRTDLSLEQVLSVASVVEEIAKAAGLTGGLCRTYIKNNWSKV